MLVPQYWGLSHPHSRHLRTDKMRRQHPIENSLETCSYCHLNMILFLPILHGNQIARHIFTVHAQAVSPRLNHVDVVGCTPVTAPDRVLLQRPGQAWVDLQSGRGGFHTQNILRCLPLPARRCSGSALHDESPPDGR